MGEKSKVALEITEDFIACYKYLIANGFANNTAAAAAVALDVVSNVNGFTREAPSVERPKN